MNTNAAHSSGDSRKIKVLQKAVSVAMKTREDTSMTEQHKFLSGYCGSLCVKKFDETVCLLSEKRADMRGEREITIRGVE